MKPRSERVLPYFPVIPMVLAYLGLCFAPLVVQEARYAMLGVITLPWAAALIAVILRIRREQELRAGEEGGNLPESNPPIREGGETLSWVMLAVLGLLIAFFTLLHHSYPQVFKVPVNRDLPFSSFPEMLLIDLGTAFLAAFCFFHSLRAYGFYRSSIFVIGSFIFTGLQESIWILLGRFEVVGPSYYFTKAIFWFFETPALFTCLGWYYLAYSTTYTAGYLLPHRSIWPRAVLAGLLAVNFDLWGDPLATHSKTLNWIWLSEEHLRIFSIPFTNFVGWFLLIFVFALFWERVPGLVQKHGTGKSALFFLSWCLVADVAILGLLGGIRWALSFIPFTNLTWWGI